MVYPDWSIFNIGCKKPKVDLFKFCFPKNDLRRIKVRVRSNQAGANKFKPRKKLKL